MRCASVARALCRLLLAGSVAASLVACQTVPTAEPAQPNAASTQPAAAQTAPDTAQPAPNADRSTESWNAYAAHFLEWHFSVNPAQAVRAGRHDFDGKLPDWSAPGIARVIEQLHAERARAERFDPDRLDAAQRFERELVLAQIDGELFWLESAQWPFRNPAYYLWALEPRVYVARAYAPLEQRMRAYVAYANAIPAAAAQIRANLRTPLPRSWIASGRITFGGLARFYEQDVPGVFAAVRDAVLQAEFRAANGAAIRAMRELDGWLKLQEPSATADYALGAARFEEMLRRTEGLDVPVARLKAIAEADLKRNHAALREACAALAPGKSVETCVARVQAAKPKKSPVLAARAQLTALRSFLAARGVVSIPGPEQATTRESPPYMRWNAAYIDIPGPYESNLPSTYYIAPPNPAWTRAEQRAYIPASVDLLFISVHEVWPGHFLQALHAHRAPSQLARAFASYAYSEGWAHYAEEMMWDAGLGKGDPKVHVGQLLNALLRNVRLLSALGLHAGGMSVAEAEAMFKRLAFQSAATAREQAARGTFDPAYGNYTLGKLMIRKLRDDWTALRGGRTAWRAFHDEFLRPGAPPIPIVRRLMLGEAAGAPL